MFQLKKAFKIGIFLIFVLGNGFYLMGQCVDPVENLDTSECFATIQAAIDDADTVNGHTIFVQPGTYTEQVTIDKSITLEGYSQYGTRIEYDSSPSVVLVTADEVTIKNLGVFWTGNYNSWYSGIKLEGDDCVVDNVTVAGCPRNVYIYGSSGNTISNCLISTVYQDHEGITIGGSQNVICNNMIVSSPNEIGYGIILLASSQNTVVGNTIRYFEYGIYSFSANDNDIYHNNFYDNTYNAYCFLSSSPYNRWDDGGVLGGNYWGSCTDTDNDCICDSAYTIAVNEVDNYPLACARCN